jgi:hypothetical protein
MPVRKYRSVADMPDATWRPVLDPQNLRLACQLSALAARLFPVRFPAGVHRYRSVGEAFEARRRWERAVRMAPRQNSR